MARIKNATFAGSPPRDVVGDASIFRRWLSNAVGDIALVTDLVTGANAEPPITHTGGGLGCQMRIPLAAQHIDRSLVLQGAGASVAEDNFWVIAVPVFVPTGEAGAYRLTVTAPTARGNTTQMFVEVLDTTWTTFIGPSMGTYDDDDGTVTQNGPVRDTARWTLILGEGLQYLMVKRACRFADADPFARLVSWALDHDRTYAGESNGLAITGSTVVGSPYEAPATLTPSTVHDTYDEEVAIDGPLSAYVLTRLNRHINALWEYVTGAKIPGNAVYKNATTWDHSRASFTAEGLVDFPVAILALGSVPELGGKPSVDDYTDLTPAEGLLDWIMHPTARSMTADNFANAQIVLPSFSTSSSLLKCAILVHSPSGVGNAANWRFRVTTGAGSSASVAGVQLGTSSFLVATVTAIPFAAGDNSLSFQFSNTAAGALGAETLDILGACLYFEAP